MNRFWLGPFLILCACGAVTSQPKVTVEEDEWVSPDDGDILGIVVTPDLVIVPVGSSIQLEALGLKDTRETISLTDAVAWASSDALVATISNDLGQEGMLVGESAGVTTISADFGGLGSAPARITVTDAGLERLAITPGALTVGLWDTVQLSAEATFSDGSSSDASSQVRWITGDGSVLQLSGSGELEATGLGATTVRAEWNGVASESVDVEVVTSVDASSADLYFDWVSGVIDDGIFEVMVSIHNDSDAPVYDIWLDLFVDPDYTPGYGDWPDWYHQVEYLGPNESTTVVMSASTSASVHTYALLLDSLQMVPETNESNNLYEGSTDDFVGSGGGGSDLLPNLEISYVGGVSGLEETEYWVDVTNNGEGSSSSFYVDVFHDLDESEEPLSFADGDAYQFFDGGLAAGQTEYITLFVDATCDACGAWVVVDIYDMVEESNESDNSRFYAGP
jgi:hypothetical protein